MTVYDHTNYGGRSLLIKQQNANFGNDYFHDRVESATVRGNCRWLLYEHGNFGGQTYILSAIDYASYHSWGGTGNRFSSARALPPPGTVAIALFQHPNYNGRMVVLYRSNHNLSSVDFGDTLSSFIVIGGSWTIFYHPNYYGTSGTYGPGEYPHPPSGIGHDQISSVRKN